MEYADEEIKEDGQGCFLAYQPNESINQAAKKKFLKFWIEINWLSATPFYSRRCI